VWLAAVLLVAGGLALEREERLASISDIRIEKVEVPLRRSFATSRDRLARDVSRIVRVTVLARDGSQGVGECVAVQYVTGESQDTAHAALLRAAPALIGMECLRPRDVLACAERELAGTPSAFAGLEMALFDAFCAATGISWWSFFGGAATEAATDVTLPMVPDARERAIEHAAEGYRCFKVKVGRADPAEDLSLLADIARALPHATFRLDANQAFTPDSALRFVEEALRLGVPIDYLEQPVDRADLRALDYVAARSSVPVFADEAVLSPADALRVVEQTRVHGLNVKLMKAGVRGTLDIAAIARAADRDLMIGCMLESCRGIGFALAVATGCGAFSHYDLDSHLLLREDGGNPFFEQDGPTLRITRK